MIARQVDAAAISGAIKSVMSDSIPAAVATVAATKTADRTSKRDANSGAVYTKGSRLISYQGESFVSLVV